ncbi:MAG: 5'-3' exonuclease H3TH domain-containing protein, partial [Chthoniobacterales bacterium]
TRIYSTNKSDVGESKDGFALLGSAEVEAKWGVPPEKIPDVLALTGDAVDNIPGVEGVGPKTAAKLVLEHGSVAALLGDTAEIKNEKLRAKVEAAAARIRDNMELVRLDENLPLPVPLGDLGVKPDLGAVVALAKKCEFRSLLAEYEKLAKANTGGSQGELF